jgi:hypothetical protein
MGADIETIATGGLAEHIVPFTEEIDETGRPPHADRPTLAA